LKLTRPAIEVLGDVTAERINAIGAKLFCGGRALVWTTTAYDEETLKPTNMDLTEVLGMCTSLHLPSIIRNELSSTDPSGVGEKATSRLGCIPTQLSA